MNETVLFLVIGAAVILVGLFLWSRMEAKKNSKGMVGISREPRDDIYGENGRLNKPKLFPRPEPQESENELGVDSLTEEKNPPFVVTDVSDLEKEPSAGVNLKPSPDEWEAAVLGTTPQLAETPVAATSEVTSTTETVKVEEKKTEPKQEDLFDDNFPEIEEKQPQQTEEAAPAVSVFPKEGLARIHYDRVTDSVAYIQCTKAVDGSRMMDMVANFQKLGLPLRLYVRRADNKRWYQPSPVGRYTELAAVLLLANRRSCINEMDASRFLNVVQQNGIALEADTEMESSHEIVTRAQKLYKNVLRLDVQLNFIMASKEPLNPNDVAEAARLAGFTQLNPMRYFLGTAKHIDEATIFLHQDDFDRRYLSLALDAPLAQPDSKPLRTLFTVANDLCARLNLQLQDTRDRPINTESAQSINIQLNKYYKEMLEADIEPGSDRARVLFTRD